MLFVTHSNLVCKVDEQCSELMDALAAEAATGAYSTKKERNVDTA